MEDRVVLEMNRSEALHTWKALCAARAFVVNLEHDAEGVEHAERLLGVIVRLFEAIPDKPEYTGEHAESFLEAWKAPGGNPNLVQRAEVEAILDEAIAVYAGGGQDTRKGIVRAVLRDVKRGVRRLEGGDA